MLFFKKKDKVREAWEEILKEERKEYNSLRQLKKYFDNMDPLILVTPSLINESNKKIEEWLNELLDDIDKENNRVQAYSDSAFIYKGHLKQEWNYYPSRWVDAFHIFQENFRKTISKKRALAESLLKSLVPQGENINPITQKKIASLVLPHFIDLVDNYFRIVKLLEKVTDFGDYQTFYVAVTYKLGLYFSKIEREESKIEKELGWSWKKF